MTDHGEVAQRGERYVRVAILVKTKGRCIDTFRGVVTALLQDPVKLSLSIEFEQKALIPSVLNISPHVNAF